MADGVTARIDDQPAQAALGRLHAALGDATPAFDAAGRAYTDRVHQAFEDEGLPGYGKWPPLSPRTIAARRRRGHWPGPMLRVRGDLYRSITWRAAPASVEIGSNSPYAAIHQLGGTIVQQVRPRAIAFGANGRFLAHKAAMRRKSGAIGVRFSGAGTRQITIPPRPFLFAPGGVVPDPWMAAVIAQLQGHLAKAVVS